MTKSRSRWTLLRVLQPEVVATAARWASLGAIACLAFASGAWAQNGTRSASKFYTDFSDTADALLRNAASHARDKQWPEAVDIYQRVIQQFGEKVARLPKDDPGADPTGDSVLYIDVRRFCQQRLAQLPPEARAVYRSRVDGQVERWFRQGEARRDRNALRRVVDEAFCSAWGDDAVELLGDLAFQEGRFDEALDDYRRLVADVGSVGVGFVHPDPSVDLARVAAKEFLCRQAIGTEPPGRGNSRSSRGPIRTRRERWPVVTDSTARPSPPPCSSITSRRRFKPTIAGPRSPVRRPVPAWCLIPWTLGRSSGGSTWNPSA